MSTFLIAEAGINHNGKLDQAYRLIDAAKASNADAVKFQLFDSRKLWGDDRIKHLELRYDQMVLLYGYCENIGIEFMCTPFGVAELTFLAPMLKRVKIASGCLTNKALLEAANATGLPVLLSTGMSTRDEIWRAIGNLDDVALTLLHCTSSYPCRLEDVNLLAMKWSEVPYGYSDHTTSITVPIAAVALGATVIEKHFTLDRNAEGPDHKASITPKEFRAMHMAIVEVEAALGDGFKRVMPCEEELRRLWRDKR